MIYDVIDNLMPDHFNDYMLRHLVNVNRWQQASPEKGQLDEDEVSSDAGMIMLTFPNHDNDHINDQTNILANLILNAVLFSHAPKGEFENVMADRFLFNLYFKSSACAFHQDRTITGLKSGQYLASFIYTFNENDGYNIIGDEKIESKAGRCILFSSQDFHMASPPIEYDYRTTMNCNFKYSHYKRFEKT